MNSTLQIRDGLYEMDPLVGTYCGTATPPDFTSSSNFLYVRFRTDDGLARRGFTANFSAAESK